MSLFERFSTFFKRKEAKYHKIKEEKAPSPFAINTKTEVFDFEPAENDIIAAEEIRLGRMLLFKNSCLKILGFALVGLGTGFAAVFVMFCHEILSEEKYQLLQYVLKGSSVFSPMVIATWYLGVIIPAMIGSALCVFIEPKASGGGIAGVIGYVNGVNNSATHTMKICVVKVFSVLCTILSGLAAGMEGPMVHIGACIGASVTQFRIPFLKNFDPFKPVRLDHHKRDFVGGGIAAGIAGAFFAPIGGFIMALEEGMIYWSGEVVFGIFLCCIICQAFAITLLSINFGCAGCLGQKTLLYFSTASAYPIEYNFRDLGFMILQAVLAGLSGAAWNFLQLRLILLRKKFIKQKWHQLAEMFVVAFVTATVNWGQVMLLRANCIKEPPHLEGFHFANYKFECEEVDGEQQMSAIGALVGLSQPSAIKVLFLESEGFDIPTLASYSVTYFFISTWTMGSFIAGGIFVPNIVLGATWGRLYGELLQKIWPDTRPNLFAIVGAGAQLCGVIRVPLTIAAIMVETCSARDLAFPLYIAMIVTTMVGNSFNHSIYHTQCYTGGMPMIQKDPPPFLLDIEVQSVMSSPVVGLPRRASIQNIILTLTSNKHHVFAILRGRRLIGTIRRSQLIQILRHRLYEKDVIECYKVIKSNDNPPWTAEKLEPTSYILTAFIDLGPFTNMSPYTILTTSSLVNAYNLMANIGSRHIIVVNRNNDAMGVLTRKDVVHIRDHASCCVFHVTSYPKI